MHLRTRPIPFYWGLKKHRKTGWHIRSLNIPPGKNFLCQEQRSGLCFKSWAHYHYSFLLSPQQAPLSRGGLTKTIKKPGLFLWKHRLVLYHCWLQRAAHRARGQHILTLSCTSGPEVTTPRRSNTARSSVVINLISYVNQSREVSIFRWLLFSFWTQEIKIITGWEHFLVWYSLIYS